jgi:hypothetical protein
VKRIQRQRTKGWRMPEGAIYVGRPTRWGNLFTLGPAWRRVDGFRSHLEHALAKGWMDPSYLDDLRGATALACWCPLDQPCHADVLIDLLEDVA